MTNNTNEARTLYREIRTRVLGSVRTTAARFDQRASELAREFADGEPVEPRHWVMAASELGWILGVVASPSGIEASASERNSLLHALSFESKLAA